MSERLFERRGKSGRAAVFVPGFLGWGERDGIYPVLPYWGLSSGNVLSYIAAQGFECRAASPGSLSSAWDRACELYAELCGGKADYGIAHSEKYGHARFGTDYKKPLIPGWQEKSLSFIAHSFGGATVRLFLDILANGRPEEVAAAKGRGLTPSQFFMGGGAENVRSVTTIAAPHNGTTLLDAGGGLTPAFAALVAGMAKALGISDFTGAYDFRLSQFGICRESGEPLSDFISRMLGADFLQTGDHALRDLSVDGAAEFNSALSPLPGVYYFSYPCCRTHMSLASYHQHPDAEMSRLLKPYALIMGRWYGARTPGGRFVGKEWLPNDGLVNTVSAAYPAGERFRICSGEGACSPGVWNVMPVTGLDHLAAIGGGSNCGRGDVKRLYLDIMGKISSTYNK